MIVKILYFSQEISGEFPEKSGEKTSHSLLPPPIYLYIGVGGRRRGEEKY